MDEMKVKSKFMTGIVSKIIKKVIRDKSSCDVNIQLNEIDVAALENTVRVHLDVDLEITKEEFNELLKRSIGF